MCNNVQVILLRGTVLTFVWCFATFLSLGQGFSNIHIGAGLFKNFYSIANPSNALKESQFLIASYPKPLMEVGYTFPSHSNHFSCDASLLLKRMAYTLTFQTDNPIFNSTEKLKVSINYNAFRLTLSKKFDKWSIGILGSVAYNNYVLRTTGGTGAFHSDTSSIKETWSDLSPFVKYLSYAGGVTVSYKVARNIVLNLTSLADFQNAQYNDITITYVGSGIDETHHLYYKPNHFSAELTMRYYVAGLFKPKY